MATSGAPKGDMLSWEQSELVYSPLFNPDKLTEEQRKAFSRHTFYSTFPTALVIILHFITLSIFTLIYFGLKHSKLPIIRHNDFGAGKAIGFMFIPVYNFYWVFRYWIRLVDRINFQFKLRGQPWPVSRGLAIANSITSVIPWVNLISYIIVEPIVAGQIQIATNRLAKEHPAPIS